MRPPSLGPFGVRFTSPCRQRNPGRRGSWSWCAHGLLGGRSLRLVRVSREKTDHLHPSRESLLGKTEVDSVKRHDQVFRVVDLLECANDAGLSTDSPCEVFVRHGVLEAHALLVDEREVVLVNCRGIVAIIAEAADGICQ